MSCWIVRFISNCHARREDRTIGPLTPEEIQNIEVQIRELRELVDGLDQDRIQDQTVDKGVKWLFNPPLVSHFGGVHEVMIKGAKKAIHAVLCNADVNDKELTTAFVGVDPLMNSLMNSRPLTIFFMARWEASQQQNRLMKSTSAQGIDGGEFKS